MNTWAFKAHVESDAPLARWLLGLHRIGFQSTMLGVRSYKYKPHSAEFQVPADLYFAGNRHGL